MGTITYAESMRRTEELLAAIDHAPGDDALLAALDAALAFPCAPHQMQVTELWTDIAETHRRAGRYDEAIAAYESATDAGFQSNPHPRANVAELLLEAGRRDEGDALYAELRALTGDEDIWIYNSGGHAYASIGDHAEALRWVDAGIELGLATGDPEQLIEQLADMRERSRTALDLPLDDDLAALAAGFTPGPRTGGFRSYGTEVPFPESCDHCGWRYGAERSGFGEPADTFGSARLSAASVLDRSPARSSTIDGSIGGPRPEPVQATSDPVGRNDPCPCGSGQKYKRCHGR